MFNWSEFHLYRSNFLQNPYFRLFTAYYFTNFTCTAGEEPGEIPVEDPHKEDPVESRKDSENVTEIYEQKSEGEKSNAGSLLLDLVLNNEYLSANFASNCLLYA